MKLVNYEKKGFVIFLVVFLFILLFGLCVYTWCKKINSYSLVTGRVRKKNLIELYIKDKDMNIIYKNSNVYIGDKKYDYTVDGENYQFNIPNNTKKQDVTIMAVDAAGNKTNYVLNGILVTTNTFIRWYNNKPLFAGSIAGAAVVTGGGVGAAIALRSGRIKIRRKRK